MTWVRLDDQFSDHPKVVEAGPLASWLYVCGLSYCSRQLTDGFIPLGQVRKLADVDNAGDLAERLCASGLWDRVDGGFQIHDYLDYQPSAEKVKSERAATAKRQADWRDRRRNAPVTAQSQPNNTVTHGATNGVSNGPVTPSPYTSHPLPTTTTGDTPLPPGGVPHPDGRPVREHPTDTTDGKTPPPSSAPPPAPPTYPAEFEAFWSAYPVGHGNKNQSGAAWNRIRPDPVLRAAIHAGLDRWKASDRWQRGFVVEAQRWLRDRGWEDVPPPAPPVAAPSRNGTGKDIGYSTAELIAMAQGDHP